MAKIFYWLLPFYLLSFIASTAGQEIFGWLIFLLFLFVIASDFQKFGLKNTINKLKIGADIPVLFFWGWSLLTTILIFQNMEEALSTFRSIRWVFLLYGFSYLLKKYFSFYFEKLFKFTMISAVLVGIYGIFQMFTGIDLIRPTNEHLSLLGNFHRATGFFKIPLTYAYCLGMVGLFGYTAFLFSSTVKKNYWLYLIVTVSTLAGVIASSTRGAWIALFVAIMIATFLFNRKKAVNVFLVSILVAGILTLEPSIRERAISIFNTTDYSSNTERISLWRANLEMFKDHPVLGVGPERSRQNLSEYYQKLNITNGFYGHAHNDFLNTLSGVGILGTLAWLWFCLYFLKLSYLILQNAQENKIKSLALGTFAAQIYMHVGGLTQVNFYDNEVNHILIFIWAILIGLQYKLKVQPPNRYL